MADINQVRRQQLRKLVGEYEGMTALARKLGLKKGAYISQLLTDPPVRTISEKTARGWEKILSLSPGWMDSTPQASATHTNGVAYANGTPRTGVDVSLLTNTLAAVGDALASSGLRLSPGKVAELVAMQYEDASRTGRVDHARIQLILGLIQG